ncbi:MAG: hypothetical protein DI626_03935 [Micavibrio aeruginosavorus]|uniref:Uncharacterized protein n=1 Tax=Micavibrio aeruginosavorus TaxID=349221 RepID=A0A2W5C0D1_9BACT|nr:MAG: hypothetical protein DI626_03935 [Micavibrio aeruginosavorus]
MSKIDNLHDLFVHTLSDQYNAEKQLTKALPKMAKAAENPKLVKGFETHLAETEDQIAKLDKVFEMCDIKPEKITCEAMKGLIEEGEEAIKEFKKGPLLDVALIVAAQKVEHYEISGYGSLCTIANKLGYKDAEKILNQIKEQERATDEKLTELAINDINDEAFAQAA